MRTIKKFTDEELVLEGIHENDRTNFINLARAIKKYIPSFDMNIIGNSGAIMIGERVIFKTEGSATVAVISAYMSGLYGGLIYDKK